MPERSSGARLKMKNYEIMFIVNPNTPDEEVDKINSQVEGVITSGGGQVQKTEKMGKRKLACSSSQPTAISFAKSNAGCE